jgi:hypothetical protein
MRRQTTTRGRAPMRTQATLYAMGPAVVVRSPEIPYARPRNRAEATDGLDRAFFLWLLAVLVAGTVAAGLIAMSCIVTIMPSS